MPNVLMEAMAAGLPVVATRVAGNAELIEQGWNGYLVGVEDHNELAIALKQLLLNPQLRDRLGQNGQKKIKKFTWRSVAEQYLNIIRKKVQK